MIDMSKASEFPLGSLQMYILSVLWSREMYGLEIIKHLKLKGYLVGSNQLYPTLKRLESLAAVESRKEERVGTTRIYYKITLLGKQLMMQQLLGIIDLFQDILLDKLDFMGEFCGELLHLAPGMQVLDISKDFYDSFILGLVPQILPKGMYYILTKDEGKQSLYQDRIEFFQYEQNLRSILTNNDSINLPDKCIDTFLSFFTIRNISSTPILKEVYRVLKPDGNGLIIDWPMANTDVRKNMVLTILPEKRGIDSDEICKEVQKYGFKTVLHHGKQGIEVIELKKA
jgi:DNA-binding PadR family transcriptional regulator